MRKEDTKHFLNTDEEQQVVGAIQSAEKNTSGEIRVHIEGKCPKKDAYKRATEVFHELGMDATELRNGVLIYLAVEDHLFAIIGDKGINDVVPNGFWSNVKDIMQDHFKRGEFARGLELGIEQAGHELKEHFPYQQDDENELSDEISKG